ncbi:hypothetical protein Cyast_0023 [Cyanobacterium stanieri PCC 7202]|uniref:Cytoplasmic protein n=1 Tax=Cyanobacterium stanieri (strain ATCC 29140 / PCC 7202) TaxID=292563 RepID=K9YHP9_CYASC|nr:hypothetical protein Cyast_0023 [Cyanobacterium stanieri PCC 7202]
MENNAQEILIRYGFIAINNNDQQIKSSITSLATVLSNILYYGFGVSPQTYEKIANLSEESLIHWWQNIEPVFAKITGDDKNIQDFVVYKNFPNEVLNMTESEYWMRQVLMYCGFPNEYFTQEKVERESWQESVSLKILQLSQEDSLFKVFENILYLPNRWTEQQWQDILCLLPQFLEQVNLNKISFKENLIQVLTYYFEKNIVFNISSATDILRLAIALSDGDVTLRKNSKIRSFKRKERKLLLASLDKCQNLREDIYRHKKIWKKLLFSLHPGDYQKEYSSVVSAYDFVYNNKKNETFNSQLELFLEQKNPQALELLKTRPGEFVRRLRHSITIFGEEAITAFEQIIPQLKLIQLVKLHKYLETINDRFYRTIPPKGNWQKMRVMELDETPKLEPNLQTKLLGAIALEIQAKINTIVPTVNLEEKTKLITLQTNDSELTNYGRGTVFIIPNNVQFIRSASYWRSGATNQNIWYDNGWNFFDQHWQPKGSCCWDYPIFFDDSAIFSGDPTNSKDAEGNGCQLIDLYPQKLRQWGIRYAVWNILCFSHLSFNVAQEVYASLQWGEKATEGELFEPSRCQLNFPIKGDNLTKYIALIDLEKNHLIYLDANLAGRVRSANLNLPRLKKNLPAFMEYLHTIPTVFDLFKHQQQTKNGLLVAYDDQNIHLNGEIAYIFQPSNSDNNFTPFSLTQLF